jgi:hypothetical protein
MPVVYSFTPPTSGWQEYSTSINITTAGNYALGFYGTIDNMNSSSAIQNIQLTTSVSGTYTYDNCQQASIDGGYRYFGLQSVNVTTSKGYCAVSNNEPIITSLGQSYIPSGQIALWSSQTINQTGNTTLLTSSGALSVLNSNGQAVFNTPNASANPSNYLGCYNDTADRAMELYDNGNQNYNLQSCQQAAQTNGFTYFGLQNSTSGSNAQCVVSNDFTNSTKYGIAGNCTKISDGTWSGGGYSNAVYNTSNPSSNYFLILQDDGNMCIYRGTGPNDNQGFIWCSETNGKQQQPNPNYSAVKGKYGKNWIPQGSTLAAGDFVGSTNGSIALIMQTDGNLVLYTFTNVLNCQKMSDNNIGGGVGANALYDIGAVGVKKNMSQLAYIDQDAQLHAYPSDNTQYTNVYTSFTGVTSDGNDIQGASYGGATVDTCKTTCNKNAECAGFVLTTQGNVCLPKTAGMYPNGETQFDPNSVTYVREKSPITPPIGVSATANNTDSIVYQNYINGGEISKEYGLADATSVQKQQLSQLQTKMDLLASQISNFTTKFGNGTTSSQTQSNTNVKGIQGYLTNLNDTNNKITNFSTNIDNILDDSDIVVLQKNYDYLFWTILATGTLLVSMNLVKK